MDHVRAKPALAAKKAQGVKLGNQVKRAAAGAKGDATRGRGRLRRQRVPIVRESQAAGATTSRAIVAALNARGVRTARKGNWHDSTVRSLLARAGG